MEELMENNIREIHFPIVDPERPNNNLYVWYYCLMDYFADSSIDVYLHDRVYVSIAAIASFPSVLPLDEFEPERSVTGRREIPNPKYEETLLLISKCRSFYIPPNRLVTSRLENTGPRHLRNKKVKKKK